MGYYTWFKLEAEPPEGEDPVEFLKKVWDEEGEDSELQWAVEPDGSSRESTKWYEWQEDMRKLSLKWPGATFHLSWEGEAQGDQGEATFRDGKAHIREAQVIIEPFDETKLV